MPHLLIVDDEPSTSWALAEGLSDDGYTIDTFRSAEDALSWLRASRSDLVIADFNLPGMNGLELARKLRRGSNAQPVIMVTAYGTAERLREFERAGVAACFPKPFRLDQLRRAVSRALDGVASRPARLRKAA
jgi:two-component system response regulator (stage 0 sporulation protein F)